MFRSVAMSPTYHGVQLLQSLQGSLGPVLAHGVPGRQELAGGVLVRHDLAVQHGERVDPGQDEVLGDLGPQASHAQDTQSGCSQSLLGVQTPQSDLTVVQLGLLLGDGGALGGYHGHSCQGQFSENLAAIRHRAWEWNPIHHLQYFQALVGPQHNIWHPLWFEVSSGSFLIFPSSC